MKEDVIFKKTPFGGFDRFEVISYIQNLKETQQKYKIMLESKETQIRELSEENSALAAQVETLKEKIRSDEKKAEETELKIKSLSAKYEILLKKTEAAEKTAGENKKKAVDTVKLCDNLVETAGVTAREIVKNAEDMLAAVRRKVNGVNAELQKTKNMPAKDIKALVAQLAEELSRDVAEFSAGQEDEDV